MEQVRITEYARLSGNPLRKLTFEQKVQPNPDLKPIQLQLGDPTVFGNFPPAKECVDALRRAVNEDTFLYNPNAGRFDAREAVARYAQNRGKITNDDVILTSGCNHALEFCILTLAEPGENILFPRPCYTYKPLTDGAGIESKAYDLDPSRNWDVDLEHLESIIDCKTRAIVVNHPGNPCGNVFSREHIEDILEIAERHKLVVISDEVYEYMVYPGVKFHPIASVSKNVPVLTCGGLTKRFVMPGIRLGWIIVSDKNGVLKDVKEGLKNCTGRILGPNSLAQYALPDILKQTPKAFFDDIMLRISRHAMITFSILKDIPGLKPIMPKGSMYMMVKIDSQKFPEFQSCLEFSEGLIREQSVLLFPGVPCFNFPGFIRIVLTVPEHLLILACERIRDFCKEHYQH